MLRQFPQPFIVESSFGIGSKASAQQGSHLPPSGPILDRYGHLMPGSEEEAAGLLDSYLAEQRERAEAVARGAGGEPVEALTVAE